MGTNELLVSILLPLVTLTMIFGIVYLNKRENLAMIEKGLNPKIPHAAPFTNLKYGLLLAGSGFGLLLAYILDLMVSAIDGQENASLYFALIAIFGGVGLVTSYYIERKDVMEKSEN